MKAYELSAKVTPEGILIPDWLRELLPNDREVKVIILVNEQTDSSKQVDWSQLTTEQFFAGYEQSDNIYDSI